MSAKPQLTSANGTPEEPLPESPVLTAREDDIPHRVRRVIRSFTDHGPEGIRQQLTNEKDGK